MVLRLETDLYNFHGCDYEDGFCDSGGETSCDLSVTCHSLKKHALSVQSMCLAAAMFGRTHERGFRRDVALLVCQ